MAEISVTPRYLNDVGVAVPSNPYLIQQTGHYKN